MDNGGENIEILELSMIHHLGFENETIKFVCTIFLAQQTIIWNTSLKKTISPNIPGMKMLIMGGISLAAFAILARDRVWRILGV